MNIKILGSGCASCTKLAEAVRETVDGMGIDATVEKVTDLNDIMAYGVMTTPGLVIDEQVKAAGRVPSGDELERLIRDSM